MDGDEKAGVRSKAKAGIKANSVKAIAFLESELLALAERRNKLVQAQAMIDAEEAPILRALSVARFDAGLIKQLPKDPTREPASRTKRNRK